MLIIGIGMIAGMLTEGDGYSSLLKEFIASRALIFVTGVLALVAGLAIVNAHNLWVRGLAGDRDHPRLAVHPARRYPISCSRPRCRPSATV